MGNRNSRIGCLSAIYWFFLGIGILMLIIVILYPSRKRIGNSDYVVEPTDFGSEIVYMPLGISYSKGITRSDCEQIHYNEDYIISNSVNSLGDSLYQKRYYHIIRINQKAFGSTYQQMLYKCLHEDIMKFDDVDVFRYYLDSLNIRMSEMKQLKFR